MIASDARIRELFIKVVVGADGESFSSVVRTVLALAFS
jgi:hypothetical protein